ncbi:MAG: ATP-binding cassette domain-containing protein [Planctomycetes bacterium]|nr:ATP-binding cassette domain-containing protein [Planctomycetota bacterium]
MTDKQIVIDVRGLSRSFGEHVAVDQVSFQVKRGAIFGLLGPNGAGKSTIIRMLCGVLSPSAGSATVLDRDATDEAEAVKRHIGYMSQKFSLYPDLSIQENIDFYGRIYGLSPERLHQRRKDVLELTGLQSQPVEQLAGNLSGGWKQRLALACALVHEPQVLFLDEPTAGIDPVARRQLWDLLFELSGRGVTMLVTTHYMDEAERCTDVGYIYQSKLLVLGEPDELKQLPQVTPPGTRRLEIDLPHPVQHLSELREHEGIRDATLFGQTIHVLAEERVDEAEIARAIDLPDDQINIRVVTPTLEDVFVTLTKNADRGEMDDSTRRGDLSPPASKPKEHHKKVKPRALNGLGAVMIKEFFHIRRQPTTIFFMLVVPLLQLTIFGYAINTQIEHIPTIVYDLDGRPAAREMADTFANTRTFRIIDRVHDRDDFRHALTSGRAQVGVIIPPDYSDQLLHGEQTQVQVLIDGSDSQVATTAMTATRLLGFATSLRLAKAKGEAAQFSPARDPFGELAIPVDVRPRLLYNPALESSHFFVPGLVAIILQLVTLFLTSFAIVREREVGTLEQLFVTPVGRAGLMLGKLLPYSITGFVESLIVLTAMVYLFGVPIHGNLFLLMAMAALFIVCALGLGLLISTLARTQMQAMQFSFMIMLPSVLLSGFMFPRAEMPLPIYLITFAIPVTYFIEILRGIVLRGAEVIDLVPAMTGLAICMVVILTLSITRFRKQLG